MSKYKVSLYACPAQVPFIFAIHPWFVLEKDGMVSRWEVGFQSSSKAIKGNHLYKDFLPPFTGIPMVPYTNRFFWKSHLLGSVEGDENSLAQKIFEFIENSKNTYSYHSQYAFTGPNSNTYVQWVLNHFPEFKVKLSAGAIGKNYHV